MTSLKWGRSGRLPPNATGGLSDWYLAEGTLPQSSRQHCRGYHQEGNTRSRRLFPQFVQVAASIRGKLCFPSPLIRLCRNSSCRRKPASRRRPDKSREPSRTMDSGSLLNICRDSFRRNDALSLDCDQPLILRGTSEIFVPSGFRPGPKG